VLRRLTSPVRENRLPGELGLPAENVAESLAFLRDHDLLFEEGERLMSLVMLDELGSAVDPAGTVDASPGGRRLLPLSW
jgi:hypothetical protein